MNNYDINVSNNIEEYNKLLDNIEKLKKLRKKIIIKETVTWIIGIPLIILPFILWGIHAYQLVIFAFLSVSLCALVVASNNRKQFKMDYKFFVITYIIKKKFSDAQYNPYKGISRERISNTNMIYMGNQYKSSDYVYGKYKDISFSTSDIQTLREFKTKNDQSIQIPMFTGQWFIFDFNKTFKADIQVCEKWFMFAKRRVLLGNNTLYRYKLEDIRFNQEFKVYAQNELDVFYVLTPNMIERIKNVKRKVRGKIMFCFIENKIHIGLYRYVDLFENRPVYKKIDLDKEEKYVLKNLRPILEFIDGLDLDNDLFKM